jgi:surface-anchored protein
VDGFGVDYLNDAWDLAIHDRDEVVKYAPDEALLFIGPQGRTSRPSGSQWDFLGVGAGQDVWVLPQTQSSDLLFLGGSAQEMTPGTFTPWNPQDARLPGVPVSWIQVSLIAVRGPGHFSLWQTGSFGSPVVWMSTAEGGITASDVVYVPEGGHVHFNWGFSTRGFYEVDIQTTAYLGPDQTNPTSSAVTTYYFSVDPLLHVTRLTPTNSGFTVGFSRPIDGSTLNLYDTQAGGLGPADVTLTGATVGALQGSLLANATGTCVRFLQTGGVLPPDTYTVTLRSAANGFKDQTGGLLDGNNDGTTGDNYVGTFTVSPSAAVVVSVPDFARGPGQAVNVPATATGLPLRLSDGNGVTAVNLTLVYNPDLLTITAAAVGAGLPEGATVALDTATPGRAVLSFTSPTALAAGLVDFVTLTAQVPNGAGTRYTAKQVLDLTNVRLNNGLIAARDDDGLHAVGYFGDTTGNGGYSALDAQRIARVVEGLDSGFLAYQATDPRIVADVTGDGLLSALDAVYLAEKLVGLDRPQIPPLPGTIPPITVVGPDPTVNIPTTLAGSPGGTVTAPVNLDAADGVVAIEIELAYDTALLDAADADVAVGALTGAGGFTLVGNVNDTAGTVRVVLFATTPLGPGSGSLVEVNFRISPAAPAGTTRINLQRVRLENNAGQVLTLTPPPEPGEDPTDGLLTITP